MCNITPQASERICKHMNEDHGVSVYAMVLATLANTGSAESKMKISNCQLKNISLTQMDLSFVACDSTNGGSCLLKDMVIHFDPPLESSRDMRLVC
jgi:putative heme iron utilization protein